MFMLAYLYIHVYYLSGICNERCVLGNKQDFTSFIDKILRPLLTLIVLEIIMLFVVRCLFYIIHIEDYIKAKHECIYC